CAPKSRVSAPTGVFSERTSIAELELGWSRPVLEGPLAEALHETDIFLHSVELLGMVREAFRRTVDYVGTRQQFGRPIGSFQAVQHRLADSYSALQSATAL